MNDPNFNHPADEGGEPRVPDALAADLERLHRGDESVQIPHEIDERILMMAKWRLAEPTADVGEFAGAAHSSKPRSLVLRLASGRWIGIAAAAAVLVVAGILVVPIQRGTPRGPQLSSGSATSKNADAIALAPRTPWKREDINADGVVDILDAQRLAYLLNTKADGPRGDGERSGGGDWDINADGRIDELDAREIARHVVVLAMNGGAG